MDPERGPMALQRRSVADQMKGDLLYGYPQLTLGVDQVGGHTN